MAGRVARHRVVDRVGAALAVGVLLITCLPARSVTLPRLVH